VSGLRKACIVCCLLLLGACSSTTFFYNRLDFILPWYLDDYAELNRDQEKYLDELLTPFLAWHRAQELPLYVELLGQIESSLDQPIAIEDLAAISAQFEAAWFRVEEKSINWLLDLGERLSEEQMSSFMGELWKQQREYEDKYLDRSDKEFREDSYDSMLDSMQDYLGKLDKSQRQLVRSGSEELLRSDRIWLAERAAWLDKLGVILQREPGWQQRIREAIAQRDDNASPEYLDTFQHNMRVIYGSVAQVLNSRSSKQDKRLRGKLADLREDLETLIAQGKAASA
jgi:hypothetical protein